MIKFNYIQNCIFGFVLYCVLFLFQQFIIFEVEQKIFSNTEVASLLFLPHAARVLTFLIFGWFGAIGVLFGHIVMFEWLLGNISELQNIARILVASFCAPIAILMLQKAKLELKFGQNEIIEWRHIIIAGALASVINGCLGLWFIKDELPADSIFSIVWTSMIGDTMGLLVVMLILPSFFLKR